MIKKNSLNKNKYFYFKNKIKSNNFKIKLMNLKFQINQFPIN